MQRLVSLLVALTAVLVLSASANASRIIGRDATDVRLQVNAKGMALVTFKSNGQQKRVLAWGAVNEDTKFKLDYSGGYGAFDEPVWKSFRDASLSYDGPELHWLVAARKAPDGS